MIYEKWLGDNKEECIKQFAEEFGLDENEVEDWYAGEFDKYCREWFDGDVENDKFVRGVK